MENGWVKIHRKVTNWEWWDDHNTSRLFIYLLLKANHSQKKWKGKVIERGQLITGLHKLHDATGISIQSLRTSLDKLISTNEITIKSTNKYSLITIVRYSEYQSDDDKLTSKLTSKLTNKQQTTNNKQEYKERKKEDIYVDFVNMFNSLLSSKFGYTDKKASKQLEGLMKSGIKLEEVGEAIKAASEDSFLMGKNDQGKKYLTPEYITRPSNFEKYHEAYREDHDIDWTEKIRRRITSDIS